MKVGELLAVLNQVDPNTEVKIGSNLIREITSLEVTRIATSPKLDLYPWVAENAWDNYKVDINTAVDCVLIQVE